jgi:hypothetical protein
MPKTEATEDENSKEGTEEVGEVGSPPNILDQSLHLASPLTFSKQLQAATTTQDTKESHHHRLNIVPSSSPYEPKV